MTKRKTFIIFMCLLSSAMASEITIGQLNGDTNAPRAEEGFAAKTHRMWRANERAGLIQGAIQMVNLEEKPDIWLIQEGRKFKTKAGELVDSISPVTEYLGKYQGYQVLTQPYNNSGEMSFVFVTAYNPNKLTLVKSEPRYFSLTPDTPTIYPEGRAPTVEEKSVFKANTFGEDFERCAFFTQFKDKETGNDFWVVNVHLYMGLQGRLESMKLINKWTEDLVAKDPKSKIVFAGDFNTFSDFGGPEMMKIIEDKGLLEDSTRDLTLKWGKKFNSTFFPFPYDYLGNDAAFRKEIEALPEDQRRAKAWELYEHKSQAVGGHLDHALVHGFSGARSTLIPTPTGNPEFYPHNYTEEEVKAYVLAHKESPSFASDHQIVVTKLSY